MTRVSKGYVVAELGALAGALLVAIGAAIVFRLVVLDGLFEDDVVLERWAVISMFSCMAGATIGCWTALRRRGLEAAGRTALLLLGLLLVIALVLWRSSDTFLQSSLYPYGFVLALVSPLVCRAVALRSRRSPGTP